MCVLVCVCVYVCVCVCVWAYVFVWLYVCGYLSYWLYFIAQYKYINFLSKEISNYAIKASTNNNK